MQRKITSLNYLNNFFIILFIAFSNQNINAQSIEILEAQIQDYYFVNKAFPGILHPSQQSKISFEIPGKVSIINVDIGDEVTKGQILAQLDSREINAQLKQAKARFDLAKIILQRVEGLRVDGHVSDQQLD